MRAAAQSLTGSCAFNEFFDPFSTMLHESMHSTDGHGKDFGMDFGKRDRLARQDTVELRPGSSGRWMLVANEASSSVTVFGIDPATGRLTASAETLAVPKPVSVSFLCNPAVPCSSD